MRPLLSSLLFLSFAANAAGTLEITAVSDLNFGSAVQGDSSRQVSPGTSESSTNGSFQVSGSPHTSYSIVLPSESVQLVLGAGGPGRTLQISGFQSFPAEGANGSTGSDGTQMIFIGATRASIPFNQTPGHYSGNYSITIVY